MAVRQSPGVYITEYDESIGLEQVGLGGVGVAVKLNKGPIGKPFSVSSENDFVRKGGKPIPGFNMMGWHSVNNMFEYQATVVVSRVEKTLLTTQHDNVKQYFELPVSNAQVAVHLTGESVQLNFNDEVQMMIKNRELFKTTNINNIYDVANEDDGIDIQDVDPTILIDNSDTLEQLVEDKGYNTKANSLVKFDKLAPKTIEFDDVVDDIEVGQVYDHNGVIVDIEKSIYDYDIIEIEEGSRNDGDGTISSNSVTDVDGVNTQFTSELKHGSTIKAHWYSGEMDVTSTELLSRDGSDFKTVAITSSVGTPINYCKFISVNDKIIVNGVERIVSAMSFTTPDTTVSFTTEVPSTWVASSFSFKKYVENAGEYLVDTVMSDTSIRLENDTEGVNVEADDTNVFDTIFTYDISETSYTDMTDLLKTNDDNTNVLIEGTELDVIYLGLTLQQKANFNSMYFNLSSTTSNECTIKYYSTADLDFKSFDYVDNQTHDFSTSGHIYVSFDKTDFGEFAISGEDLYWIKITGSAVPGSGSVTANILLAKKIPEVASEFKYRYLEELTTISEQIYADPNDTTGLTINGLNVNFFTLLRVGSKITISVSGTSITSYVSEIISPTVMKVRTSFSGLGTLVGDAKVFTYSNSYVTSSDIEEGTKIYTENGYVEVYKTAQQTTADSNRKFLVKNVTTNIRPGDNASLVEFRSDEWMYFTDTVISETNISKEDNVYAFDYTYALDFTTDDFFLNTGSDNVGAGTVKFIEDIGESSLVVFELTEGIINNELDIDPTNIPGVTTYGTVLNLVMYDNIKAYEIEDLEEDAEEIVMVNHIVTGMTEDIKEKYTYMFGMKSEYSETATEGSNLIIGKEFIRVFAKTPGSWADEDNIAIAICDMDNFDTALLEEDGIPFKSLFEFAPDTSDKTLMAFVVIKDDYVVERFIVSTNPKSKSSNGSSQYITDVVNRRSAFVNVLFNTSTINAFEPNGFNISFNPVLVSMVEGGYSGKKLELFKAQYEDTTNSTVNLNVIDGYVETSDVAQAYELFRNVNDVSIGYLVDGEWTGIPEVARLMQSICVHRGDSVCFIGPKISDIVGIREKETIKQNLLDYIRDNNLSSSGRPSQFMGFYDNMKQIYDLYNDTYVWIAMSSDVVAKNSYIDNYFDPWYATAGQSRGAIQNIVKTGWNSDTMQRDELYPARINSIITEKGVGTYIYGEKSLLTMKSDLGAMHNRKTLNYIEVNLKKFMKTVLWEFNDAITRGRVVNTIEPFLRNIKAKRGLINYQVICDESNNPLSVVQDDTIIIAIYLKMAHVIDKVELQFIVTKADVSFDEVLRK